MTLKIGMKCRTRAGQAARVITDDILGDRRFAVAVEDLSRGSETVYRYPQGGAFCAQTGNHELDLIELPKVYSGWVNVYQYDRDIGAYLGDLHASKSDAIASGQSPGLIARILVTFTEGEGL